MNQRPAKMRKPLDPRSNLMEIKKSLHLAATLLENSDLNDEAFYFHQLVEWIQEGNRLPLEPRDMTRALGL